MALVIDDAALEAADISEEELRLEIAILLYQQGRFSAGKASSFAGWNRILFLKELADRKIPVNYDEADFFEDLVAKPLVIDNDSFPVEGH